MDTSYIELEPGQTGTLQNGDIKIPITYISITSDSKCISIGELCVCLYDGARYYMLEFTPKTINKFHINNIDSKNRYCICAIVPLFRGMNDICLYLC